MIGIVSQVMKETRSNNDDENDPFLNWHQDTGIGHSMVKSYVISKALCILKGYVLKTLKDQ